MFQENDPRIPENRQVILGLPVDAELQTARNLGSCLARVGERLKGLRG